MARGAEAKARRKTSKKEARAAEAARINELQQEVNTFDENPQEDVDDDDSSSEEEEKDTGAEVIDRNAIDKKVMKGSKRRAAEKKQAPAASGACCPQPGGTGKGIKTAPLVLLILMTGTTVLPALLYAGDWFGNMIQKHHIMGSLGYKLGVGASPKKRVLSFYEKHDPSKIEDVPSILAKHYGDYPKLVKRLERKYGDYGYFINWEQDEAPMQLAKEKLEETFHYLGKEWQKHAPRFMKTGARNMKHNFGFLYKKGRRIWRTKVWPMLEPIFGVPDGGAAQKRKDAAAARKNKKGRKTHEYRDDDEM